MINARMLGEFDTLVVEMPVKRDALPPGRAAALGLAWIGKPMRPNRETALASSAEVNFRPKRKAIGP